VDELLAKMHCIFCGKEMLPVVSVKGIGQLGWSIADGRMDVPTEYMVTDWLCEEHGPILVNGQVAYEVLNKIPYYHALHRACDSKRG
jgi:hypothetical protein